MRCDCSAIRRSPSGNVAAGNGYKSCTHPRGGGGTQIILYILRFGSFFGVQNLNFNIFGGFQKKMNIFWGYEDFVYIFGGYHKIGLYLGVISMHFRVFS